jgi:ABC-type multidrug transport system ATPase subunit
MSPSFTAPYMLREMALAAIRTSRLTKDYGSHRGSLRGGEIVAYLGGMRGGVDPAAVRKLAERFDLDLSRRFREYSSGNKQKLAILLAFMHRPELLILDEPTSGLDPLNQQEFYALLREARDDGATVFLSSHVLSEVERVCDRVGIVRAGTLVRVAQLDELRRDGTEAGLEQIFLSYFSEPKPKALNP